MSYQVQVKLKITCSGCNLSGETVGDLKPNESDPPDSNDFRGPGVVVLELKPEHIHLPQGWVDAEYKGFLCSDCVRERDD